MADKNKKINQKLLPYISNVKYITKDKSTNKTNKDKNSYKIIKKIGEGSFGVVYLVYSLKASSRYVLKKIDLKGLSKEEIKETSNEVNLLKKLDHPNIIKFVEVIKSKRYLELYMEFAEKGDLYDQIILQSKKNKYFPEKTIIDWLIQSCQALKYIHSKHIIHRDIKPQNIFLTKKGSVKLGDFGVSKTLNNTLEKAKTFVGTAYYLPPEIINGKKYSFMADIWSLGVSFYQLMTFKMPFDGDSIPSIMKKICDGTGYAKISKKHYSEELINLVYKMMDSKPSHRPKPGDILNMDFIRKRIELYLKENQFDNMLSKTIIKQYQDNYIVNNNNETNNNDVNDNKITTNNNKMINNSNISEISFKNKLKFNNLIAINKDNNNTKIDKTKINKDTKYIKDVKDNKDNEDNADKKNKEENNDNIKPFLGQFLLTKEQNVSLKTKEKEKEKTENLPKFDKIKIKIISSKKNTKSKNDEKNKINKIGKVDEANNSINNNAINNVINNTANNTNNNTINNTNNNTTNNTNNNDNNDANKININNDINNINSDIKQEEDKKDIKFDSTIKTNQTSYNPDEEKYGFETKFMENKMIYNEKDEKEINLENINEEFFFETKKEDEIKQNLKDEYDHQRQLNLLSSFMAGKPDNEVENENKLINHNESDIEEDEKDNEDDNNGDDTY